MKETLESQIADVVNKGASQYDATRQVLADRSITKADVVALATKRGLKIPQRATKADATKRVLTQVAARVDDAESIEFLAAEEEALTAQRDAAAPVLSGDIVVAAEDVLAGDTFFGTTLAEVSTGKKWTWFKNEAGDWFLQMHRGVSVGVTR